MCKGVVVTQHVVDRETRTIKELNLIGICKAGAAVQQKRVEHLADRHVRAQLEPVAGEISQCRQVIRLRPDNPWGYTNLGAQMERLGNLEEARELYDRASKVNPTVRLATARAYSNLAGLAYSDQSFDRAAELYEHSVRFYPAGILEWDHLAHAYFWAGREQEAQQAWQRVISLSDTMLSVNPTNHYALQYRADAFSRTQQQDSSLAVLARLEALPQKEPDTVFEMAMIHEFLGNRQ